MATTTFTRKIAKGLDAVRQFPWTLALSATLSLIFVVFVAALIAFMQYQTRLQRSQPGLPASQLVYYVDTEIKIENEQRELATYSEAISTKTPEYSLTFTEINYRVDRICALFDKGQPANADTDKCRQFLSRIPFEGTAKPSAVQPTVASVSKKTAGSKKTANDETLPIEPISDDLLDNIMANFREIMGPKTLNEVEFAK